MALGKRIHDILKKKGLTIKELSRQAGVPYTTLYSLIKRDSNNADRETVEKIANALNCNLLYLLGVDAKPIYESLGLDYDEASLSSLDLVGIADPEADTGVHMGGFKGSDNMDVKESRQLLLALAVKTKNLNLSEQINLYAQELNEEGRKKVLERIQELLEIPKYRFFN